MMFLFLTLIIITILHGASRSEKPPTIYHAKTCREMFDGPFGKHRDGFYLINPSQGDPKNSIYVYCIFETRETCLHLKSPTSKLLFDASTVKSDVWIVKSNPRRYQFTYEVDANQLRILQQISKSASQTIIYLCKNTIVYYDSINKNFDKSVKLLGWNNDEITPQNLSNLQFMSGHDGCQHKNDWWSNTRILYSTNIPSQLPITDIAIRDVGRPGQFIDVHIGRVCFL
ncbi:collagen alpha-2(I) chain-like [Planococcus citri]|uniref:collagen alpha-2(I) chain-like n=1 Tax=Planococcus citri TaxID=170843 RepID=UPI0031F95947